MRTLKFALFGLLLSAFILACENDTENPASGEISPFAKNYLTLKMGSMTSNSMASTTGFANTVNASFNRISSASNLSFGRMDEDSTKTDPDTTYYPSPWTSCAQVTTTVNRDNSVTTIYDYGDGCMEGDDYFKYLMYGRYTYTYLYESQKDGSVYKDHYSGSYSSENYGGEYYWEGDTSRWQSNGSSTYSGTSEYDTASQKYSGHYEYEGNDVYSYDDITYSYSGRGEGSYNELGSIILLSDYSYTTADYSYETKVLEPLVSRYECYQNFYSEGLAAAYCFMPTYVSGKELIKYRQGDEAGSFIIDYGDGDCDSKIIIIENGTQVEIDLYELYNIM
jgi:hypothetical protein